MASATTGWSCQHRVTLMSETNTNVTIRVNCHWKNDGSRYNVNYITAYVYCNGEEQKVLDNANVTTTDIGYNESESIGYYDFTIAKTTSAQNISCYAKIVSKSSYAGSQTKSSTASSITVAAKPYHTITYNANGGTGAPAAQTKWYNETIKLSSTRPTRSGYSFVRWNMNTANTGLAFNPGDSYSSNANLLLYAIWNAHTYLVTYNANGGTGAPSAQHKTHDVDLTLSSTKPTRTDYNFLGWSTSNNGGVQYAAGAKYTNNSVVTLYAVWELAYVKPRITNFSVQRCDSSGTITEDGTYVKVSFNWNTDYDVSKIQIEWKTQTENTWTTSTVSASGKSGTVNKVVGGGSLNNETSYTFRAFVKDRDTDGTTYSPQLTVGTIKFPIDVKKGGTGVSVGKAAEEDNVFDVAFKGKFRNGLMLDGKDIKHPTVLYDNIAGSNGTITLTSNISAFDYLEIYFSTVEGMNIDSATGVSGGYSKIYVPVIQQSNKNNIVLSMISTNGSATYFVRSWYFPGSTSLSLDSGRLGYGILNGNIQYYGAVGTSTSYIKITKVVGIN